MRITNTIKLELTRFIDKDYECKHSVLTIHVGNDMRQITGAKAEAIYDTIKEYVEVGEDIVFEEDEKDEDNKTKKSGVVAF